MVTKPPWTIKKTVMPQHTDHAGVMWHGSYLNWLEEARIKAIEQSGLNYAELLNRDIELPVSSLTIKFVAPIYLNEEIIINSFFESSRGPRLAIYSKFMNKNKKITTEANINLVLIRKTNFTIIRRKPEFIEEAFKNLCEGPKA